jgi:hypothetical protein
MSTTAEIIEFVATDVPQCNSTIEEEGELPAAHAVGTYSVPPIK